jgi:hypothetical protein
VSSTTTKLKKNIIKIDPKLLISFYSYKMFKNEFNGIALFPSWILKILSRTLVKNWNYSKILVLKELKISCTIISSKLIFFIGLAFNWSSNFKLNFRSLMGLNAALNMIDPESKQFFIRRTARELIWGYDDTLSAFAR